MSCDIVPMKGSDRITEKEKRFAQCYMKTLNATQAYIDAGYKAKDRRCAGKNAAKIMKRPDVKQYIDEGLERVRRQSEVETGSMVELLFVIANTSPANLAEIKEIDGKQQVVWKRFEELDDETKKAIALIKNTKDGVEISLLDRMKAIEMLFKYMGLEKQGEGGVVIIGEKDIED